MEKKNDKQGLLASRMIQNQIEVSPDASGKQTQEDNDDIVPRENDLPHVRMNRPQRSDSQPDRRETDDNDSGKDNKDSNPRQAKDREKHRFSLFRKKKREPENVAPEDSSKWTEQDIDADFENIKQQQMSVEKKEGVWTKVFRVLLIVGCVYMIFLIFGVFVTQYSYDESGEIVAQRMSVSDLQAKQAFQDILTQYEYCRILYENTLMLDYRLGAGVEDPLTIAPEYEGLLDDVENLSVKTDALTVDSQYDQIKSMLLSWIQDDIAVYLQNMAAAISQNDSETANYALQDYERVYDDFSMITQNIIAMGETIPGIDLTDIKSWTPESYIDEEINGS